LPKYATASARFAAVLLMMIKPGVKALSGRPARFMRQFAEFATARGDLPERYEQRFATN
jgi:hypothetical protein